MKVFRLNSNFYKWYINYISATYIYTSFRRTLLILYRTYIDRLTCYLNSTQRLLILHRSLSRRSISTLYINSLKKKKKKEKQMDREGEKSTFSAWIMTNSILIVAAKWTSRSRCAELSFSNREDLFLNKYNAVIA